MAPTRGSICRIIAPCSLRNPSTEAVVEGPAQSHRGKAAATIVVESTVPRQVIAQVDIADTTKPSEPEAESAPKSAHGSQMRERTRLHCDVVRSRPEGARRGPECRALPPCEQRRGTQAALSGEQRRPQLQPIAEEPLHLVDRHADPEGDGGGRERVSATIRRQEQRTASEPLGIDLHHTADARRVLLFPELEEEPVAPAERRRHVNVELGSGSAKRPSTLETTCVASPQMELLDITAGGPRQVAEGASAPAAAVALPPREAAPAMDSRRAAAGAMHAVPIARLANLPEQGVHGIRVGSRSTARAMHPRRSRAGVRWNVNEG